MKFKTTQKAIKENYKNIIKVYHNDIQVLLSAETPIAYISSPTYGWKCDIYKIGNVAIFPRAESNKQKIDYFFYQRSLRRKGVKRETKKRLALKAVYREYKSIVSKSDLYANGLTYSDYESLFYILKDLFYEGKSQCISKAVANWCKRMGLNVTYGNTNYFITL